jgi:hypothetical protein
MLIPWLAIRVLQLMTRVLVLDMEYHQYGEGGGGGVARGLEQTSVFFMFYSYNIYFDDVTQQSTMTNKYTGGGSGGGVIVVVVVW